MEGTGYKGRGVCAGDTVLRRYDLLRSARCPNRTSGPPGKLTAPQSDLPQLPLSCLSREAVSLPGPETITSPRDTVGPAADRDGEERWMERGQLRGAVQG